MLSQNLPPIIAYINTSKPKLVDYYFSENTKLRRRRERRKNYLGVIDGYLTKGAKALVVSELIAIFHPRDGKF